MTHLFLSVTKYRILTHLSFFNFPHVRIMKKVTSYMHIRSCYAASIHLYAIFKVFAQIKLTNFETRFWTRVTCHMCSEDTT